MRAHALRRKKKSHTRVDAVLLGGALTWRASYRRKNLQHRVVNDRFGGIDIDELPAGPAPLTEPAGEVVRLRLVHG